MAKSIESKIRINAAIIYMIVALGVAAIMVYFNDLRQDVSIRRLEVEHQYTLLSAANELMFAVNHVQSSASLYMSSKNKNHLSDYTFAIDSVEAIIETIIEFTPKDEDKLDRIKLLLREQELNIKKLDVQFAEKNPVTLINQRLQEFEPYIRRDTVFTTLETRVDTVINEIPRRGIFRRLGDVFNPSSDTVRMVINQSTDTIRTIKRDSLVVIYEVEKMAQRAQQIYEQNLKKIEKQVGELISSINDIASEISALLLEFHKETLFSTRETMDNSETDIERNYLYSTIGGILALFFILVFIVLIIADINKGSRARWALEAANQRTRQIMESRHKLLLSVSHDIKSPLNSVLGYLSLMEHDDRVRSMQHSSEHILTMLDNLLGFSSIEQGTLQISISDFNINDLCSKIYEMFLPLTSEKGLEFSFDASDVRIRTDSVKLKQIVINLVSNAIKYTPSGAVSFMTSIQNNAVEIVVQDSGMGIPSDKMDRLYLPFNRIEENSTAAEGSGLGLFVVRGLVDLLGGEIIVNSTLGSGTVVTVKIPVERPLQAISRGTKRVKVIDDDAVVVLMVSELLGRLGHKVVDSNYDLIITDWDMGDVTGLDILHQTKGAVPVVVMTGRADFSAQKAAELGFDAFLAKPVTIESLREVVGEGESIDDLFGDYSEEIVALFHASVEENFSKLKHALDNNDFASAQSTCHKMFPVFAQLGYPTKELRSMDAHRHGVYQEWQDDVRKILAIAI
ncbi:MAG: hybrid sensor histidine kinase/response regulator [Prevotellaceae bacterium]|jgi:signal transduction histidine kinase/CheY-like chemotaxis protein|nr:hybrid sensor histidine kinase/response regulator [Prevotellaceae bacterium]